MGVGLLFFAGILALVVWGVRIGLRRMRERQQLEAAHPGEPWMWRHDWADRAVVDDNDIKPFFLWLFGFLWILMSLPALYVYRKQAETDRVVLIFLAIFPIVGICVLIVAAYQSLRRHKYGVSTCRLQRLPIAIGSTFRGEVQARVRELPESGFQVRIACIRRVVRSSGKSRSVRETVLWQDEQTVGSGAAMPSAEGMRVPVHFAIPRDAEPTDDSNPRDSILWRLEVRADVPGIDYLARFTLPVYRTNDAPESDAFPAPAAFAWTPPPQIVFGLSRTGGEHVVIKSFARLSDWLSYLFFLLFWYGALGFIEYMGGPIWVIAVFAVFGTIVIVAVADLLVGRSTVSADRVSLTSRRSWLGIGRNRTFASNEVESIVARVGRTTGSVARYDVEARFRDGRARLIARHLMNRRDAEGVAARISRALGH